MKYLRITFPNKAAYLVPAHIIGEALAFKEVVEEDGKSPHDLAFQARVNSATEEELENHVNLEMTWPEIRNHAEPAADSMPQPDTYLCATFNEATLDFVTFNEPEHAN